MQDIEQKEGEGHRGNTAHNGNDAAGEHPVNILRGGHGHHHRDVHLLPEGHTVLKVLLLGEGEQLGVSHKQQKQDGKSDAAYIRVNTHQGAEAGADIFT